MSVDSLSLIIQDSQKAELQSLADGAYMLYAWLWEGEAPVSIGISDYTWEKFQAKYPTLVEKIERVA